MNIALLGMGTIGSGVYELLKDRPGFSVKRILDKRTLPEDAERIRTESIDAILEDPEIDTIVELLGGVEPAHYWSASALRRGKNLVSANKLMLSSDFGALLRAAEEGGAQLRISASVGGGIPWLPNLLRARRLCPVQSIGGIVNGTTNFILDAMQRQGIEYSEALARAQRAGYAEVDPSADVDGIDARSKLSLSASIAFNALVDPAQIPTAGIRGITGADAACFRSHGWVCRLLANASRAEEGIHAVVEPALLPADHQEASVLRNDNCISFTTAFSGTLSFIGQGAGKYPTAFAVVNDLIDIRNGAPAPEYVTDQRPLAVNNAGTKYRYYVRTSVPLPFAAEPLGDNACLTEPQSVSRMHEAMRAVRAADPAAFYASLRGE